MPVTPTELFVTGLARRSFLSLWSHANPGYGDPSRGRGKELCDLLVVFQDSVILFSDKNCAYPATPNSLTNWKRWYRRCVESSTKQLIGAKRTIQSFPERVYTDCSLETQFPYALHERSKIFLIAVTHGSDSASKMRHGGISLDIDSTLVDDTAELTVGCKFSEHFVHVVAGGTLEILLNKLDTIRDFVDYLAAKEVGFTKQPFVVRGEENLLAIYLRSRNSEGNHTLPVGDAQDCLTVENGEWTRYISSTGYQRSTEENRISYNIDNIIEHITEAYCAGEMVAGQEQNLAYHEAGLRLLASESRFGRRVISKSLTSILAEPDQSTFWASTVASVENEGVRYVFITYPPMPAEIPAP